MRKKYPSKVSYGLLGFIFLVFFGPMTADIINLEINGTQTLTLSFLLLVFAFIVYMFFFTVYIIEGNKLKVKSGFITFKTIDINQIKEISKTNSLNSAPAPSFDRIEVKYGKFDEILLSPKNKYDFVNNLIQINPEIIVQLKN